MKNFKILINVLLFFFVFLSIKSQSVNVQINYAKEEFIIQQRGDCFQIRSIKTYADSKKDSSVFPYIPYFVVLPHGAEINNLHVFIKKAELFIDKTYFALPQNRTKNEYNNLIEKQVMLSFDADTLSNSFPKINDIIVLESPELMAGYLIIKLQFCPFQYYHENTKLYLLLHTELRINYNIKDTVFDFETSERNIEISKNYVRKFVLNPDDLEKILPLEEKIDYSKIKKFEKIENEENQLNKNQKSIKTPDKEQYYLKKIK